MRYPSTILEIIMKGKVSINITKKDYVYIDGATGEQLTAEQFRQRHSKGIKSVLGAVGSTLSSKEGEGEISKPKNI